MRNNFIAAALIASVFVSCTGKLNPSYTESSDTQTLEAKLITKSYGTPVPGSILIKVDEEFAEELMLKGIEALPKADIEKSDIENVELAIGIMPKNEAVARKYGLHKWFKVTFDTEVSQESLAGRLAASQHVVNVQYNTYVVPSEPQGGRPLTDFPLMTKSQEGLFDDELLSMQWNLVNTGNKEIASTIVEGADVGVKDAWKLSSGDRDIVVAVIDCAIKYLHEDLSDAVWVNEAEKNGKSGVDDDGNGYIDDIYGFNFVGCNKFTEEFINGSINGQKFDAIKGNRLNPAAGHGHGTHVAGIIGATNNNGKGVSSIAGGSGNDDGVRLMSCQIFEGSKSCSDAQSAAAFIYAADNGASIANCSYGLKGGIITSDSEYIDGVEDKTHASPLEYAAMQYFIDPENANCEAVGGNIIVCSAGNDSAPYCSYPGALDFCVSVTGIGPDYLPGGYSNYGPGCKIAAPGGDMSIGDSNYEDNKSMILSTGVQECAQYNNLYGAKYTYMQGTSMAAPHVSGVTALGMSYAKKLGKKFTREEFLSLLLTSVNNIEGRLSGSKNYVSNSGTVSIDMSQYAGKFGTGVIDAWKFLMNIEGVPTVMVKKGESVKIDLKDYVSDPSAVKVSLEAGAAESLGIDGEVTVNGDYLVLKCSKTGSGKIKLNGSVGKDPGREDGIQSMEYERVISIASRDFVSGNGGWF